MDIISSGVYTYVVIFIYVYIRMYMCMYVYNGMNGEEGKFRIV